MGTIGQNIQDRTDKLSFTVLLFRYGSTALGFCDSSDPLSVLGVSCAPTPAMEVEFPKNTGVFDTKAMKAKLPYVFGTFTDFVSSGEPMPEITVQAYKYYMDPNGGGAELVLVQKGTVSSAARNPDGQTGVVEIRSKDKKALLDIPMGVIANVQCPWSFGSAMCKVFVQPHSQEGTIRIMDGKTLQIEPTAGTSFVQTPNANQTSAGVQKYWHKGFIHLKNDFPGAHVTIRDWDASLPGTFEMSNNVSTRWLNQEIVLFPGCDRYIQTCRERWNQEIEFGGVGINVPAYDPEVTGG